jgi:hypothetical protein
MSLDVSLTVEQDTDVYSANITHNLGHMAEAAGIYRYLWRPEELGITHARDLIPALEGGLERLQADPEYYQQFNSPNGWGTYEHFVPFVERYLEACRENPNAKIGISR